MVFSSIIFIFYFLPVFLLGYYVSGWRAGMLLAGSAAFYVWGEGAYLFLLVALIGLNFAGSLLIARQSRRSGGVLVLAGLITLDFAVLGYFKYAAFLAETLNGVIPGAPIPAPTHALPLGISFFTFQLVSYVVDVHRRTVAVERDPLRFATYILMFPHLIAGPIVRYADIRDEMHGDRRRAGHIGLGVQYFLVGLSQKILVANAVAPLADQVFGAPTSTLDMASAWLGAWAYTLQIYFDFCGYSNMAIGLAFLLGFTFPKNFDYPYAAQSISEFWRRWHISLSSWFRDYVYIPLGGNRLGGVKTARNLLIVFFLTGLWHGAAWQFIVWGLFHGAFLMLERYGFARVLAGAPAPLRRLYVLVVVAVGWVFFRADSLPTALGYLEAMVSPGRVVTLKPDLAVLLHAQSIAALVAGSLLAFPLVPWLLARVNAPWATERQERANRLDTTAVRALPASLLLASFVLCIALLVSTTLNPFLYFRF
jgi:alginate O-acetyltransferase complex protein AlgI